MIGNRRRSGAWPLAAAAALLWLAACSEVTAPYITFNSGFYPSYSALIEDQHRLLGKVELGPNPSLGRYFGLVISEVKVGEDAVNGGVDPINWQNYLFGQLHHELQSRHVFPHVTTDKSLLKRSDIVGLEVVITELKAPPRWLKALIGEVGPGKTKMQVEGRLYNGRTGENIFRFIDRQSAPNAWILGGEPSETWFRRGLGKTAANLAQYLLTLR